MTEPLMEMWAMDWYDNKDRLASATADGKEGNPAPFSHPTAVTIGCTPSHCFRIIDPSWSPRQRLLHWLAWRVRIWGEGLAGYFERLA